MTVRIDEEILLSDFIGWRQLGAIRHLLGGEERNGMRGKILEYAERVARMPKIGDDSHVAFLHYFMGGADWYILEKDTGNEGQIQAFGWAEILPGAASTATSASRKSLTPVRNQTSTGHRSQWQRCSDAGR